MTTPNKTPPGADPKQLERTGTVREIGSQAVWSLSSCKPGFGVDQLRDDNLETYWQSDGSQPHLVNIQFRRKTTVKTLCIYADYKSDESYTPSKISVRVGNNFHNLQEIRQLELVEPSGWIHVPLTDNHKKPTRTFMIQIAVLANHQNGRDTHMRQIKIYTPVEESSIGLGSKCRVKCKCSKWSLHTKQTLNGWLLDGKYVVNEHSFFDMFQEILHSGLYDLNTFFIKGNEVKMSPSKGTEQPGNTSKMGNKIYFIASLYRWILQRRVINHGSNRGCIFNALQVI
uniref:Anaphase-promoting complex subunit 10 n=1 Tax=Molossus molossus TaxID=27622 RepID=A0A7J8I8N2_MOLMO|nr:hypothetical protein HJG59_010706 [Molossus molossus]